MDAAEIWRGERTPCDGYVHPYIPVVLKRGEGFLIRREYLFYQRAGLFAQLFSGEKGPGWQLMQEETHLADVDETRNFILNHGAIEDLDKADL